MADDDRQISYQQWGVDFFREAVSEARVLGAVNGLAGQPIDFGPMGVGPGRLAKVRAYGAIGQAVAQVVDGDQIGYQVRLPVTLTFELDLQVDTHTFHADLEVPLRLRAEARPGVRIFIVVQPPRPQEVAVTVSAEGLRASIVQRVANVEGELRRFVATYVARELEKPHIRSARLVDVSAAIDKAWASIAPGPPRASVTSDFNAALEQEIRQQEGTFLDSEDPA